MPRRQPFTALCQLTARGLRHGRADLHVHTTASDGTYTPEEIISLARCLGLSAVAVTDHDTLAAVPCARRAAEGTGVEVISGVEITAEHKGREVHLLGYFVQLDHAELCAALAGVRHSRAERFVEMARRLGLESTSLEGVAPDALGRRHLAEMLVRAGRVGTVRDAFQRFLHDRSPLVLPKKRVPAAEALALVRQAGGVAAWAHPAYDATEADLADLHGLGLGAVEVDFPDVRPGRSRNLRAWAAELGMAVTAGSDCHGPGKRSLGAHTLSATELERLRALA